MDGYATGAGYGYNLSNGNPFAASALPGGYPNVSYDSPTDPNACTYSTQTFSNNECEKKVLGGATINTANLQTTLSRLTSRYTAASNKDAMAITTIDSGGSCVLNEADGTYSKSDNGNYKCLDNGAKYIHTKADTVSINSQICLAPGTTMVIDVEGTLVINGNIIYDSYCRTNSQKSNSHEITGNVDIYQSIADLPQMLIFADNINITNSVTTLDAWLIAGDGNGEINTCSDVANASDLSADKCYNQLTVNGPVFASKILLNRTAGAGTGSSSIRPAEIFNLRTDVYLWAFSQAQNFSQAVTVYSREMAPRF